jgi:hypothetical protein
MGACRSAQTVVTFCGRFLDGSTLAHHCITASTDQNDEIFSHLNRRLHAIHNDKHHRGQSDAWKIVRSLARIVILQFVAGRAGI